MKRTILLALATLATVVTLLTLVGSAQAAATCGNSFPGDGHNGPWYASGGVHGNTVSIDCPSGSTHWDINYKIQFGCGTGCWSTWFNDHRSGNGSPSDFGYLVQAPCDGGLHVWRTHIDNNITGGNINKPAGGSGVFLGC